MRSDVEAYAGCVSGAIDYSDYINLISETGFKDIRVEREKRIEVPENLTPLPSGDETGGVYSITVAGFKP